MAPFHRFGTVVAMVALGLSGSGCGSNGAADLPTHEVRNCDPCREIVLQRVLTLGSSTAPVALSWMADVTRTSDGFFLVGSSRYEALVSVWDSMGRFVQTIGREGPGPGEFIAPRTKQGPVGRAWIVDPGTGRITEVLPGPRTGRSFPFHGSLVDYGTVPLDSNRVVVAGSLPSPGGTVSSPLHIVTGSGRVIRSFGAWYTNRLVPPAIAPGHRGGIWALPPNRYRLTRWSLEGDRIEVLRRDAWWFQSWTASDPTKNPHLLRLTTDPDGRLWIFARLVAGDEPVRFLNLEVLNQKHDFLIEVIDPDTRTVEARSRFPHGILVPVAGSNLLYAPRQTERGYEVIDLYRPTLR
jgi:hypothetical protein